MSDSYQHSIARMERAGRIISVVATIAILILAGWRNALGFACGAVISQFNFGLWKRIAGALDTQNTTTPYPGAALLVMRYLLIAGVVFAIIKVLGVSALAVIGGLFVTAAAVLVEMVRQLVTRSIFSSETK